MARERKTAEELAEERSSFGRRLRAARLKAGHATLGAASEASGVDRVSLGQMEAGQRSPSVATVQVLVAFAGYEPRLLFPRRLASAPQDQVSDVGARDGTATG